MTIQSTNRTPPIDISKANGRSQNLSRITTTPARTPLRRVKSEMREKFDAGLSELGVGRGAMLFFRMTTDRLHRPIGTQTVGVAGEMEAQSNPRARHRCDDRNKHPR